MRLAAATLPALLLALLLEAAALRLGATPARARFAAAALLFATPLFAYGLLLFSHALVAACLFGAWAAFFVTGPRGPAAPRRPRRGAPRTRRPVGVPGRDPGRRPRRVRGGRLAEAAASDRGRRRSVRGRPRRLRHGLLRQSLRAVLRLRTRGRLPGPRRVGPLRHRHAVSCGPLAAPPRPVEGTPPLRPSPPPPALGLPGRARPRLAGRGARARARPAVAPRPVRGLPELARRLHGRPALPRRGAAVPRLPVRVPRGRRRWRRLSRAPPSSRASGRPSPSRSSRPGSRCRGGVSEGISMERGLDGPECCCTWSRRCPRRRAAVRRRPSRRCATLALFHSKKALLAFCCRHCNRGLGGLRGRSPLPPFSVPRPPARLRRGRLLRPPRRARGGHRGDRRAAAAPARAARARAAAPAGSLAVLSLVATRSRGFGKSRRCSALRSSLTAPERVGSVRPPMGEAAGTYRKVRLLDAVGMSRAIVAHGPRGRRGRGRHRGLRPDRDPHPRRPPRAAARRRDRADRGRQGPRRAPRHHALPRRPDDRRVLAGPQEDRDPVQGRGARRDPLRRRAVHGAHGARRDGRDPRLRASRARSSSPSSSTAAAGSCRSRRSTSASRSRRPRPRSSR